jgi:transposase
VYRRLVRGRFRWPMTVPEATRLITGRQLQWLLDGLAFEQRQAHAAVRARTVL